MTRTSRRHLRGRKARRRTGSVGKALVVGAVAAAGVITVAARKRSSHRVHGVTTETTTEPVSVTTGASAERESMA